MNIYSLLNDRTVFFSFYCLLNFNFHDFKANADMLWSEWMYVGHLVAIDKTKSNEKKHYDSDWWWLTAFTQTHLA